MSSVNNNGSWYGSITSYPTGDSCRQGWFRTHSPSAVGVIWGTNDENPYGVTLVYEGALCYIGMWSGYGFVFFGGYSDNEWIHLLEIHNAATNTKSIYYRREADTSYTLGFTATNGSLGVDTQFSLFNEAGDGIPNDVDCKNVRIYAGLQTLTEAFADSESNTALGGTAVTLWAEYANGPTPDPATAGQDSSGNARHLTASGTAISETSDPVAGGGGGLSATLQSFTARSKRGAVAGAAAHTQQGRTTRSRRAAYAAGLGVASPTRSARAARASVTSGVAATAQPRAVDHRPAAVTSARAATQQTRTQRSRWSSVSASADAIVTLFTAAARHRFGVVLSAFAATSAERRQGRRPSATSGGLAATHGTGHASTRRSGVSAAVASSQQSRSLRNARTSTSSAQAATSATRTTRQRWAAIAGSADVIITQFTTSVRSRFGSLASAFGGVVSSSRRHVGRASPAASGLGANAATRVSRQRRTSISGSADAFVALFTSSVRSRFGALTAAVSATTATRILRQRGTTIAVETGALLATLGTRVTRLRAGPISTTTAAGAYRAAARFTATFAVPRRIARFLTPRRTDKPR